MSARLRGQSVPSRSSQSALFAVQATAIAMTHLPPDVAEDDCLPEYRHLFCPDLLQDKVAFITGGGSGIGFRIAELFMRHGCHTVIASRSLPRVSTVRDPPPPCVWGGFGGWEPGPGGSWVQRVFMPIPAPLSDSFSGRGLWGHPQHARPPGNSPLVFFFLFFFGF
uniref:Peroxisomal 2,4-dienoyl-CoA reductase [(3E)-enoyl-CoA-producing] n=1 Tax=Sus scrofa TaxID=9823 RepID=A0A8D1KWQ4_PIG